MVCWDDYRFVLAVTRHGSLSAAARSLHVSQPTVARRIEQLESDLGVKLLSRDGGQVEITEAGREVSQFAERIEQEAEAIGQCMERRRLGDRPHVRISTTRGLAVHWLAPHLERFERESSSRLSLQVSLSFVDLGHYHADVAVRMSSPGDENLHGRRVAPVHCGLYACASYLERFGTPRTMADLAQHRLLASEGAIADLPQVRALNDACASEVDAMGADCVSVQIALARHGLGIGAFPCFMVDRGGGLTRVLRDAFDVPVDLWVLMNPDLKSNPAVREVYGFLVELAQADAAFLSGRS